MKALPFSPQTAKRSLPGRLALPFVNALLRVNNLALPDYISVRERLTFLMSGFDGSIARIAKQLVSKGDVVVDVGAHVGLVTRPLARMVTRRGRVYAFEPDPSLFALLDRNVCGLPQVSISPLAIADRSQLACFHLHPTSGMSNSLTNAWEGSRSVQVQCTSLDEWATDHDVRSIRLVKIDVEGAEALVIKGMDAIMRRNQNMYIVLEFCPTNLGSKDKEEELLQLIREREMKMHVISHQGKLEAVSTRDDIMRRLSTSGYLNLLCTPQA